MADKAVTTNWVSAEFFAGGYRISGMYDARHRLLGDIIYDKSVSLVLVNEVYISPIGRPAEIGTHYTNAACIKANLHFLLTLEEDDALRRDQRYGNYKLMQLVPVVITVPFFEITGAIRMIGRFELVPFLSLQTESYITLANVTARSAVHPDVSFHGGGAIVNRNQIISFGLNQQP